MRLTLNDTVLSPASLGYILTSHVSHAYDKYTPLRCLLGSADHAFASHASTVSAIVRIPLGRIPVMLVLRSRRVELARNVSCSSKTVPGLRLTDQNSQSRHLASLQRSLFLLFSPRNPSHLPLEFLRSNLFRPIVSNPRSLSTIPHDLHDNVLRIFLGHSGGFGSSFPVPPFRFHRVLPGRALQGDVVAHNPARHERGIVEVAPRVR